MTNEKKIVEETTEVEMTEIEDIATSDVKSSRSKKGKNVEEAIDADEISEDEDLDDDVSSMSEDIESEETAEEGEPRREKTQAEKEAEKLRIAELKKKLNDLNDLKEQEFKLKQDTSSKISELISKVVEHRNKRNDYTKQVKDLKDEKGTFSGDLKEKTDAFNKAKKDKESLYTKHNLEGDPIKISKSIEILERRIETDAMSFDKEQKVMKEIKGLKAQLKQFGVVNEVWKNQKDTQKELSKVKKEANTVHKKMTELASKSQMEHKQMLEMSKLIDDLREQEKVSNEKIKGYKSELKDISTELNLLLKDKKKVQTTVAKKKKAKKVAKEKEDRKNLEEKKKELDEKIKKGKKLTTEDLLLFQSTKE